MVRAAAARTVAMTTKSATAAVITRGATSP
jgi:hypothetical protein